MFANVLCGSSTPFGASECTVKSFLCRLYSVSQYMLLQITNTGGVDFAVARLSTKIFPSNQTVADKWCCSIYSIGVRLSPEDHLQCFILLPLQTLAKLFLLSPNLMDRCILFAWNWTSIMRYVSLCLHEACFAALVKSACSSSSFTLFQVRIWKSRLSRLIVIQSFKSILHSVAKITDNP